jgi:hypothetical protein
MQLITVVCALLASTASARVFTLYSDINYWGDSHIETQPDNANCWNLNGKGDTTSSVGGDSGCTTFYQERDCRGSNWQQRGDAFTVPDFLNDHIYSFRNQC